VLTTFAAAAFAASLRMNEEHSTPRRLRLHAINWAVQAGVAEEVMLGTQRLVRRRRQKRLALITVVALVLAAATHYSLQPHIARGDIAIVSATTVLEPMQHVLPDGSIVELKTGASVVPAYSATSRRVELVRGEAHFQVIKDAARPFIVLVGEVGVRAVGTSFAVSRGSSEVEVVVTTGQVEVTAGAIVSTDPSPAFAPPVAPIPGAGDRPTVNSSGAGHPLLLTAGNRVIVNIAAAEQPMADALQSLSASEISQRLAWRIPRLEFTRTPLREAVDMVNPYNPVKISLADPALGEIRISGLLRADNVETLVHLLKAEHGIRAEQLSPTRILLTSRP
jgi:transmembrane sensor